MNDCDESSFLSTYKHFIRIVSPPYIKISLIVAPTNAAFDALGADTVKALFEEDGVPTLSNILLYHVVSGKVMSAELSDGQMVPTVEEANIDISIDEDGIVMVNGATVTTADIPACNGVVHVIDSVLTPPADDADADQTGAENNEAAGTTDGGDDGDDGDDDGDSGDSGDGSLTGCAGNVLSLLAKGESPIDTNKRCLKDCDCQDGCWYVILSLCLLSIFLSSSSLLLGCSDILASDTFICYLQRPERLGRFLHATECR